ncbi:aminoglycoside phosphotransferase family protein [Actinoplanes couchii]|uniref:Aminoglycoside phosphotransferase n=1 Tax=Actinoplanes couchii TaxID=403638 RepID=A0ABQ3XFA0_9ACTN|nr:aminoglycoside phosphotransferase family protein [Actinoplanes couchii]MDR6321868.1 aminoglycoside phosphotransferase (APT) family kinase protein [Actinoplanes couchii]GID57175.1 aminoglycoside phosphotransferase [Actinoplanes couchii]
MSDLGPPPQRVTVSVEQVRELVAGQFPQWAGLPVEPVAAGGWDNFTFHLGTGMSLRLPSAAEYALAVEKEHRWLPVLAGRLPLPIPAPLGRGEPGAGYPFPWSVHRWLAGEPARPELITDPVRFALDLADFLLALRSVDATDGPRPGLHNWFRGGTLRTYEPLFTRDTAIVRAIWADALDAEEEAAPDRWFHGDVAAGNLLVEDGRLSAVIDFGTCGVGDPACDLAVAWTLLTAEGRTVFRERLAVGDAEWARGRGWALWKTLAHDDTSRVLDEIVAEFTGEASS